MEVDLLFPTSGRGGRRKPDDVATRSEVLIIYTASYDGWGKAAVSCLSGCLCITSTINAAKTDEQVRLVGFMCAF